MKRSVFFLAWIGFIGLFFIGCASVETRYRITQRVDTIPAYEEFIRTYPESHYANDAKRRLLKLKENKAFEEAETRNTKIAYEDFAINYPSSEFAATARERVIESDEAAFKRTIRIGNSQAYQGFIESYPESKYLSLASARIEFLNAAANNEYSNFVVIYPGNPFVVEAKASLPILWLKEMKEAGVVVNVLEHVKWRGLFGGGRESEEEVRQKVFKKIKEDIEKESVQAILLDRPGDAVSKDINTVIIVNYSEKKGQREGQPYRSGRPGNQGGYYHDAAVNSMDGILSDLFLGSPVSVSSSITIMDANTGFEYYSEVPHLDKRVARDKMIKALETFKEESILSLIIALNDKNENVRNNSAIVLEKITGEDLEEDPIKWDSWWEENEDEYLKTYGLSIN